MLMGISLYSKNSSYQAHPYHLVSPSPWPIVTSASLLTLTTSAVLSMHNYNNAEFIFFSALILVMYSMSL
jgi:cytochrome c oxidase subunit 3